MPLNEDQFYHSMVVPGFWLNAAWLWQTDPKPPVALGQIAGVERVLAALQGHA